MVAAALEGKGPSGGKGSGGLSASGTLQKDFRVELAKTGAAKCRICEDKIAKVNELWLLTFYYGWEGINRT